MCAPRRHDLPTAPVTPIIVSMGEGNRCCRGLHERCLFLAVGSRSRLRLRDSLTLLRHGRVLRFPVRLESGLREEDLVAVGARLRRPGEDRGHGTVAMIRYNVSAVSREAKNSVTSCLRSRPSYSFSVTSSVTANVLPQSCGGNARTSVTLWILSFITDYSPLNTVGRNVIRPSGETSGPRVHKRASCGRNRRELGAKRSNNHRSLNSRTSFIARFLFHVAMGQGARRPALPFSGLPGTPLTGSPPHSPRPGHLSSWSRRHT